MREESTVVDLGGRRCLEVQNEATDAAIGVAAETAEFVANVVQLCRGEGVQEVPSRTQSC